MHEEIRPPAWALDGASRVSMGEFGHEFMTHWPTISNQLIKSECWQTYLEPDTRSWSEYQAGNYGNVLRLLEEEASSDLPIYEAAVANKTPFIRIRSLTFPLSQYLEFEMWNYVVRAGLGETIEILVVAADDQRPLPNHTYFDYLLFDDQVALIHDYGLDGLQVGGWVTSAPTTMRRLADSAARAREAAVSLDVFLDKHGLTFPPA